MLTREHKSRKSADPRPDKKDLICTNVCHSSWQMSARSPRGEGQRPVHLKNVSKPGKGDQMRLLDYDIKATQPSKLLIVSNAAVLILFGLSQVIFDTTSYGVSDLEMASRYPTPLTPAM